MNTLARREPDCTFNAGLRYWIHTTSCKILETLSLKNTFSNFQYSAYLEFKPFPLPLPSPPFNVDCLSSQHFFVWLATLIRGEGGSSVRDNRDGMTTGGLPLSWNGRITQNSFGNERGNLKSTRLALIKWLKRDRRWRRRTFLARYYGVALVCAVNQFSLLISEQIFVIEYSRNKKRFSHCYSCTKNCVDFRQSSCHNKNSVM